MKHKYTAKLYLEDGEVILNTADDIEELIEWMNEQTEESLDDVKGEIIDNATQQVVKNFPDNPPA